MANNNEAVSSTLTQRYMAHAHRVFMIALAIGWVALVAWGWSVRHENYISARSGLGYLLGLSGGAMLLLLLTYSLRKRFRPLRNLFHLRYWFRLHMALGILAPTAILFHSGFNFFGTALNSTVALLCLLTVAASGLIGRFLYNRVHAGVYGEKIKLVQMRKDFAVLHRTLLDLAVTDLQKERTEKIFEAIEDLVLTQQTATFGTMVRSRRRARVIAASLRTLINAIEEHHRKHPGEREDLGKTRQDIQQTADVLMAILNKLPGLHLFERLFSLWHVVHLPIFGLMIITAITHVIVVHMY